ncbi:protein-tyrosine phosphatase family protein [Microlunatus parietis]|uniref:Protein-tyrosine phosphatase n=1 Tax=Microlunatus parietis TaxID=682979 RepID=A0A7Y9I3D4_9ACTN|nr:protein-tyrosine phosphatase family protein [Microlunatus parietis]NYE69402.1 protein-tyrosine phosphatase [Microlunatus parietis]
MQVSQVVVCPQCRTFWPVGGPARCSAPGHDHQRHEVHRHRDIVELPDATRVTAVSFDVTDPYARDRRPDYGVYLDRAWQPPWPHDHLDWPDFGLPTDQEAMITSLRRVLDRARAGERVELGCLGGHGRTGTALAALAVLTGHPAADAVAWTRTTYCPKAIETRAQELFITHRIGVSCGRT